MRRSLIADTTVRMVFDAMLVFSVYLLFAGHNQPGGGFVGGLVASGAVALRYIAGGIDDVRNLLRVPPWMFLSAGLLLAAGTALASVLFGGAALDQDAVEWTLPLLGKVKVTSATVFDSGVYLIVVGLILMVFESLGDDDGMSREEPDAARPSTDTTRTER
jgi:multisubunit Na+/H+ antiporter MnhB subunit